MYYNEQPDPVPIETDPLVQTESIYAAMKLRWWYYPFLSLGTAIAMFSAYLRNPRWSGGIVPTPVSYTHLDRKAAGNPIPS